MGGARAQEALYPLADYDSSQDSSGDEWLSGEEGGPQTAQGLNVREVII